MILNIYNATLCIICKLKEINSFCALFCTMLIFYEEFCGKIMLENFFMSFRVEVRFVTVFVDVI